MCPSAKSVRRPGRMTDHPFIYGVTKTTMRKFNL
jgi:hypothetical protein